MDLNEIAIGVGAGLAIGYTLQTMSDYAIARVGEFSFSMSEPGPYRVYHKNKEAQSRLETIEASPLKKFLLFGEAQGLRHFIDNNPQIKSFDSA